MSNTATIIEPQVVDVKMASVLRAKSPAERLAIAHGLWRSAARMVRGILRSEHPDWSDEKIGSEAARRLSHGAG